jgi:hypothetical protein
MNSIHEVWVEVPVRYWSGWVFWSVMEMRLVHRKAVAYLRIAGVRGS